VTHRHSVRPNSNEHIYGGSLLKISGARVRSPRLVTSTNFSRRQFAFEIGEANFASCFVFFACSMRDKIWKEMMDTPIDSSNVRNDNVMDERD
jgi:hypothetical protein